MPHAKVRCEKVAALDQLIDALRIRVAVFIQEQGFPVGWEPDEIDKDADHYVAVVDDCVVGTTRLRVMEHTNRKIERMAVLQQYRNQRVGTSLTQHVIEQVEQTPYGRLWLDAQCHAKTFYEQFGFRAVSGCYCQWGVNVPHVTMDYYRP